MILRKLTTLEKDGSWKVVEWSNGKFYTFTHKPMRRTTVNNMQDSLNSNEDVSEHEEMLKQGIYNFEIENA